MVNFKTVTGIGVSLRREGIRSRCQSLNRYAYVLNNPTTLTDPSGLGPSGQAPIIQTCGHGVLVPNGENPATWCYNHMGIGEGSAPGAFFTNDDDEFDLIGLVLAAANKGSYYCPCPFGDCGWKTQPIFVPSYSPAALSDLLNALLVLPGGITYHPGAGLNSPQPNQPAALPDWGNRPENAKACHAEALRQDVGPSPGPSEFISLFSAYNVKGNWGVTAATESAKYGLLGLGRALGIPTLATAGEGVAVASAIATGVATLMDARARYECGESLVP